MTQYRPPIFDSGFGPPQTFTDKFIDQVLKRKALTVLVSLLPVILLAFGFSSLSRDPSVDAFVSKDHAAFVAREKAKVIFGLEDPAVVVFAQEQGVDAFNPELLQALAKFTQEVALVDGVDDGVVSLASERAILASAAGDLRAPMILDGFDINPVRVREYYLAMPQYRDLLVSRDQDAFSVIIPVNDPNRAEDDVRAIRDLAESLAPDGVSVHIAGVAAMNAGLADHIASDTRVFIPMAFLTIAVVLFVALRRLKALVGPLIVIAGAAVSAVGAIGLFGSSYFLITTALPVVLVAIAVADSIHLTLAYQRQLSLNEGQDPEGAMVSAMKEVAMPIFLTSVTTACGFIGLSLGTPMEPISHFGLFAALGTMVACLLSLTLLPIVQLRLGAGRPQVARSQMLDGFLKSLALWSAQKPVVSLTLSTATMMVAFLGASLVTFDYARPNYFMPGDPVLTADELLGERFVGTNVLDVVIDSGEPEALLTASAVASVRDLQVQLENLNGIRKSTSYVDSIGLMHERLMDAGPGALPDSQEAPAQYMFLYEASGDAEDFSNQLDFERSQALIRSYLTSGQYSATKPLIAEVRSVLADWSAETGLTAELSGRIPVNEGWMDSLKETHPTNIGLAVALIFIATWVLQRSFGWSVVALLPVISGIVMMYAAMGLAGIDLAPATSMCAAIAAGLGIDFGIHLVKELRSQLDRGKSLSAALSGHYVGVMRACFFSAVSLGLGFAVLTLSRTPVLDWFGLLIAFAAFGSLFGALLIIPAIAALRHTSTQTTLPSTERLEHA